jgi:flagellin
MTEITDGALDEITGMVQRARELAVRAANGANTTDDRQKIQAEIDQLLDEIDASVARTEFNGARLINGERSRFVAAVRGGSATDAIVPTFVDAEVPEGTLRFTLERAPVPARAVGVIGGDSVFPDGSFTINGVPVVVSASDSADDALTKLKEACLAAGVEVRSPDYPKQSQLILTSAWLGKNAKITLRPAGSAALAAFGLSAGEWNGADARVSGADYADAAGHTIDSFMNAATVTTDGERIGVLGADNRGVYFDLRTTADPRGVYSLADGTPVGDDGSLPFGPIPDMSVTVTGHGRLILQTGHEQFMETRADIPSVSADSLGMRNINVQTEEGAAAAITACDKALNKLSRVRGGIGAFANRLTFTEESLALSITNTEAALSRAADTDMAAETTNYARLSVISQAGIAVLAQANQRPQQLLQLLK